ncbi:MAG: type I DNA topoisomerase [Tenericutes bacterium HGW-Tenericutes-2]|jgi:DNA topoisomerase-1|nr:MAG: type I DNA topoisomerase [Tenericutes bacterium HGW-Tenericutes-2]
MNKKLIIVESPSKSKTIASYVGSDVIVLSSKGHVRDLATSGVDGLGLDLKNNFAPHYKIIPTKQALVKDLIAKAKGRDVLIATDPDREGEAIGWHLAELLGLDPEASNRIVFREITKPAILEALNHPRPIDSHLVYSQEFRRILDRIIGFKLSKLLQSKIKSKSAGRVQSVALKLIVDLEHEIEAFIPETYYEIEATFHHLKADYIIPDKKRLGKDEADLIVKESTNPFIVKDIQVKESRRNSKPPFITSTLQQDAISSLGMSASRAMMVAQALYEGKEIHGELVGLITYMRTDSNRLAEPFVHEAQSYIEKNFGKNYLGKYTVSTKANAQDAHEAIRPTSIDRTPDSLESYLSKDELRLYKRIYNRAVASLMAPAVFDITKVTLSSNGHDYLVEGSVEKFEGHLKMYSESKNKDKILPKMELNQELNAKDVLSIEKVTTPKTRYSEATLIKELESLGIGRPSTYAQIIQTLKNRDYVDIEEKRFKPTKQGRLTAEQLDLFFNKIINVEYTSKMETVLDEIADGKQKGSHLISKFYHSFIPLVDIAQKDMKKIGAKETGESCPVCGKPLVIRKSKYGEFTACSGFPSCKYVKKD